jgi:methyltransferase (TIGR00027 family)
MIEGKPSRTAMLTALARGAHRMTDARPWLIDDPFGLLLIGPGWKTLAADGRGDYTDEERALVRAFVVARQRFAEDRLIAGGFAQYVMLGAGLDSFVWRRPDVARRLRIIEIDHPATQDFKKARAAALGLTLPRGHSYVAVDFERETLADALDRAGFDRTRPAFFSWIGVTMYISRAASAATFRTVAGAAPGSEIVFTYAPAAAELDARDLKMSEAFRRIATAAGEPPTTLFSQAEIKAILDAAGLTLAANPTRADLIGVYFKDRADGLAPYQMERVAAARVA